MGPRRIGCTGCVSMFHPRCHSDGRSPRCHSRVAGIGYQNIQKSKHGTWNMGAERQLREIRLVRRRSH
eukprot:scaffold142473_cov37-Attheya_sp.AAC.1